MRANNLHEQRTLYRSQICQKAREWFYETEKLRSVELIYKITRLKNGSVLRMLYTSKPIELKLFTCVFFRGLQKNGKEKKKNC